MSIPLQIVRKESISPRLVCLIPRSWYKLSFQIKARNDSPVVITEEFSLFLLCKHFITDKI